LIATYRLQLGPNMTFAHVRELVPYLKELGISHVYLSPSFQAQQGSTHGYDVIDPTRISEALGGEEGLRAIAEAGVGLVLDIVPNHMAASAENRYWADEDLRAKYFDLDPATGRWRRFFDIDELAAVRQEDPEVFEETHKLPLRLVTEGVVDGLRVDHPDGLADPAGYLARLRAGGAERVWVEKILEAEEGLRDWPVSGTVGYEFLNDAAALFVDPAGEEELTFIYRSLTAERREFHEVADAAKLEQANTTFQPEVDRLRRIVDAPDMERALASLPIYRTYVVPPDTIGPADRAAIDASRERGMPAETAERLTLDADAPPSSSPASSRRPPRSPRRASRTPPSTATSACSPSTRSAATPAASASRSRTSTPAAPSAPAASPRTCSSPRPTTPSAAAIRAPASAPSPASLPSGARRSSAGSSWPRPSAARSKAAPRPTRPRST
jgi:(1->4)-alpha-D-glucan 1-alpha-D-glucosylmutase